MKKLLLTALLTLTLQANNYKIFYGKVGDVYNTISLHSCNCVAIEGDKKTYPMIKLKVGELFIAFHKTFIYRRVGNTIVTTFLKKNEFIFVAGGNSTIKQFIVEFKDMLKD